MKLWISRDILSSSPAIRTASAEELRTLLTIVAHEGEELSFEMIAKEADIPRSRVAAAIALFCEEGVLKSSATATVTEEFEERLRRGELTEQSSLEVAKTIHNEGLASLIDEVARLMKKDSLSTSEVKIITELTTQYALSPEYILLLAAHIADTSRLTVQKLRDKGTSLSGRDINTVEELERYIVALSEESDIQRELRRILGIYGRALSDAEKKYFNRWGLEFGFGAPIISEAYNRATLNAGGSMKYMDKILTSWHEAGCKTVSECIAHSESTKASATDKSDKRQRGKKTEPQRYGSFDINDAFERALERSYGEGAKTDGK